MLNFALVAMACMVTANSLVKGWRLGDTFASYWLWLLSLALFLSLPLCLLIDEHRTDANTHRSWLHSTVYTILVCGSTFPVLTLQLTIHYSKFNTVGLTKNLPGAANQNWRSCHDPERLLTRLESFSHKVTWSADQCMLLTS